MQDEEKKLVMRKMKADPAVKLLIEAFGGGIVRIDPCGPSVPPPSPPRPKAEEPDELEMSEAARNAPRVPPTRKERDAIRKAQNAGKKRRKTRIPTRDEVEHDPTLPEARGPSSMPTPRQSPGGPLKDYDLDDEVPF